MRRQVNRVVLLLALVVTLPAVALGERVRRGWGRRIAVAGIRLVARACGVRIEASGVERLDGLPSCVLVPNHTSPMDIAALLVVRPGVRFVAAAELFRYPLLGGAMRALGTVPIARTERASARRRIAELSEAPAEDRQLVVFAEGRIAEPGEVLPFKGGAFVVAIATGVPAVPVAISGAAGVLPHHGRLLVGPGTVHVDVLEAVPTAGLGLRDRRRVAADVRARVVDALGARGTMAG